MNGDAGSVHLRWIMRFQLLLLPLGALAWLLKSPRATLAFLAGALTSLLFWGMHRLLVTRMLSPKHRLRWLYGFLAVVKLALIAFVLRAMIGSLPAEGVSLASGVLLFVGGILLEAVRIAFQGDSGPKGL